MFYFLDINKTKQLWFYYILLNIHDYSSKTKLSAISKKLCLLNIYDEYFLQCNWFEVKRSIVDSVRRLSECSFGFACCIYWTSRRVESSGRGRCWWAARAGIHDAHYVLQCSVELGRRPCRCSSSWAGWRSVMIFDWHLVICFLKEFIWEYV